MPLVRELFFRELKLIRHAPLGAEMVGLIHDPLLYLGSQAKFGADSSRIMHLGHIRLVVRRFKRITSTYSSERIYNPY